jgi:hypothetical protein
MGGGVVMTVRELINKLGMLDFDAPVLIRDGHHFMREHEIERVEGEFSRDKNAVVVVLVGVAAPERVDTWEDIEACEGEEWK